MKGGDTMRNSKITGTILVVVLAIVIAALLIWSPEEKNEEILNSHIDISPVEAKALMEGNPDLIVIDVSPKYDEGHLPGAINYYVGDGSLDEVIPILDPEATYLVYCHVDSASISGAQKLIDAGFQNVYRLEGNYQAWIDARYETE